MAADRWLLRQRVHRAQELLETTVLSIEEIAAQCGFGTSTNLRQHFASLVHTSPQAYRRAFRVPDGRGSAPRFPAESD
ncbi:helix-turn-helix domain-containing protein [Phytomonospora sp. NPDC050363]|uniref:helix-turn-helix domain-containing protein n=1 Tax=Phytomonospora sp. NPDC050363 TaxID=3155642 RepID=UPI0033F07EAE